ncbi:hypothetical protein PGAL8A_00447500 [Plasmodium gallinaceum]|uniref:Uncharacterized protein n=1 Tax=Plasmodium gallinaceum TaxID=5849 RepID=A0A1J1GX59_PLAGA|nr:hypothetical protein PGAL8A_00447500 [Plasmodium gallinaceum]CRG96894.1 hypothetical protein PGAL8A_00447500 [Plasmodium gallinaceum]
MDAQNFLRVLTVATSVSFLLSSLILLLSHNLYTTFILGFYGTLLSILILLFEYYEKYSNYFIKLVPSLKKNNFKGYFLIIIGSLYLGRESRGMSNISGMLLIGCGFFHIVYHYIHNMIYLKYDEGVIAYKRPVNLDNDDHYDELVM